MPKQRGYLRIIGMLFVQRPCTINEYLVIKTKRGGEREGVTSGLTTNTRWRHDTIPATGRSRGRSQESETRMDVTTIRMQNVCYYYVLLYYDDLLLYIYVFFY